jgi:hypothetical protein
MAKYAGYNADDTAWDSFQRERGLMTNREFFTSNGVGGFYEGMTYNEDTQEWESNTPKREEYCSDCNVELSRCICNDY